MKRDWVVPGIMTVEVAFPSGQLEFKLIIVGHFTCNTLGHLATIGGQIRDLGLITPSDQHLNNRQIFLFAWEICS